MPPGRHWTRSGYCNIECPCWMKKITECGASTNCQIRGGKCQKQHPGADWINAQYLFPSKYWCHDRGCRCYIPPCVAHGEDPKCPSWGVCYRGNLSNHKHYIGP